MLKLKKQNVTNTKYRENVQDYCEYLMIRGAPFLEAIKRAHREMFDTFSNLLNTPTNQVAKQSLLDAQGDLVPYLHRRITPRQIQERKKPRFQPLDD